MVFLADLISYIAYFLVMIIFMVLAIVAAKSKTAWILYTIGAIIQFIALYGSLKSANITGDDTTVELVIYFGLLIITAIFVSKRHKKVDSSDDTDNDSQKQL